MFISQHVQENKLYDSEVLLCCPVGSVRKLIGTMYVAHWAPAIQSFKYLTFISGCITDSVLLMRWTQFWR